ncbi:MAG: hypothetical protein KGQ46_02235 [Hyphomicrobiales bacterium]|nr:hypothetical protein [Hyphomicrobiales bacterium]MDE2114766.1 hypothetical protein [Hyphomicrobiales bacterium]
MSFERLKASVGAFYNKAANSESLNSLQKFAADAGDAIVDKTASVSRYVSDLSANRKLPPDNEAAHATEKVADTENYESVSALKPIQKLVAEAGAALNDKARILLNSEIPELLGAAGGIGVGIAAGAGILSTGAASGTAGAAALTSGLAFAGSFVGLGMLAGIGVVATPAVVLGTAGVWAVGRHNKNKLFETKASLMQEALQKRDALLSELHSTNSANRERVAYLTSLIAQLQAAVANLHSDLSSK